MENLKYLTPVYYVDNCEIHKKVFIQKIKKTIFLIAGTFEDKVKELHIKEKDMFLSLDALYENIKVHNGADCLNKAKKSYVVKDIDLEKLKKFYQGLDY